jgi:hypothetical protein
MKTSHALNLSSGGLLVVDRRALERLAFVVGLSGLEALEHVDHPV